MQTGQNPMTERLASIPWWESRAMWGILVAALAQLARALGAEVDEAALLDLVTGAVTIASLALAWIGRVRATRPISMRRVLPGVSLPGGADGG